VKLIFAFVRLFPLWSSTGRKFGVFDTMGRSEFEDLLPSFTLLYIKLRLM